MVERGIILAGGTGTRLYPLTDDIKQAVKRPRYSVLDTSKTLSMIGSLPYWKDSLRQTLERHEFKTP